MGLEWEIAESCFGSCPMALEAVIRYNSAKKEDQMRFKRREKVPKPGLRRYFLEEFCELYRTEKRWMILLPEVARTMSAREVEQVAEQHLEQTLARVDHLEKIFRKIEAVDGDEVCRIRPLLLEADLVLTAVTKSTAVVRKQAAARARFEDVFSKSLQNWQRN